MYLFVRSAEIAAATEVADAHKFGKQVAETLSSAFNIKLRCGLRLYGPLQLVWTAEFERVEDMNKVVLAMLNSPAAADGHQMFIPGSVQDYVVHLGD